MFDRDFCEDFFISLGIISCGIVIALAVVALMLPNPDYTKDRIMCEKEGGVWSEVIHNKSDSFCTYYNSNGR